MSCTVVAIPYAIAWVIGAVVTVVANNSELDVSVDNDLSGRIDVESILEAKYKSETHESCDDVHVISEKQFLEKSFETPFVDKNILLKTLEEHGVTNIKENEFGQIKGVTGNFALTFERFEQDKPYSVVIRYLSTEDVEEKVDNLTSEYAINVQEECYNNIVAKLNDNNMEIESEEVCDDDTIVITVNLE